MQITDIKKARSGQVCLICDGKEFFLNAETVMAAGIEKGSVLDDKAFLELCKKSDRDRAKSRALWYVSKADHSRKALYDKLCRSFPAEAAEYAVARLEELGLIDDRAYAERLARALSDANVSNREISRKLFVKGVPSDIAREAIDALSPDPVAQIRELLKTKYRTRLKNEDGVQKTYAALLRKGFSYGDVKAALKEYSEILENCEEW